MPQIGKRRLSYNGMRTLVDTSPYGSLGLLILAALLLLCRAPPSTAECPCRDLAAPLIDFYQRTGGETSWTTKWNVTDLEAPCDFRGVACNITSGRVSVSLTGNGLSGTLPPSLADLGPGITTFWVDNNTLRGTIPPLLSSWENIELFSVSLNDLSGTLPPELGQWKKLKHFAVHHNARLTGVLPEAYAAWASLTYFTVAQTNISGTLPSLYAAWTRLEFFAVTEAQLHGTLPDAYRAWTSIQHAMVEANSNLSGTLPASYANWASIVQFNINRCGIEGTLPARYADWGRSLKAFRVHNNQLVGSLPPEYSAWENVSHFLLGENHLNGTLPPLYAAWTVIEVFDVRRNNITGTLPSQYGTSFTRLSDLHVEHNQLVGTIPLSYQSLTSLAFFILDHNPNLGGTWAPEFQSWTRLEQLYAAECNFTGTLPPQYSAFVKIKTFSMTFNKMSGSLPHSYASWTRVKQIYLSSNDFSGTIPPIWPSSMPLLEVFEVSGNRLTGTLLPDFSSCSNLVVLSLSYNDFYGTLPSSWGSSSMPALLALILQSNPRLSGNIPSSWNGGRIVRPFLGLVMVCNTSICGAAAPLGLFPGFACLPLEMMGMLSVLFDRADDADSYAAVRNSCNYSDSAPCDSGGDNGSTIAPESPAPSDGPPPPPAAYVSHSSDTIASVASVALVASMGIGSVLPVASLLTMSPTSGGIALMQAAFGTMRLRERCLRVSLGGEAQEETLTPMDSPTQICIDALGPLHACSGGAVVGNVALVLGIGLLSHLLAAYVRPWLLTTTQNVTPPEGKHPSVASRFFSLAKSLLPQDQFPGTAFWAVGFFVEPTVTAAVVLMGPSSSDTSSSSPTHALLGAAATLCMLSYVLWMMWRVFHGLTGKAKRLFPFTAVQQKAYHHRSKPRTSTRNTASPRGKTLTRRWLLWSQQKYHNFVAWISYPRWTWRVGKDFAQRRNAPPATKREEHEQVVRFGLRYGASFMGYRGTCKLFFAVELGVALLSGLVLGAATSVVNRSSPPDDDGGGDSACSDAVVWGSACVASVCIALAAAVMWVRPVATKLGNVSLAVISLFAGASALCSVFSSDEAADAANALALAGTVVEFMLLLLGMVIALLESFSVGTPVSSLRWDCSSPTAADVASRARDREEGRGRLLTAPSPSTARRAFSVIGHWSIARLARERDKNIVLKTLIDLAIRGKVAEQSREEK